MLKPSPIQDTGNLAQFFRGGIAAVGPDISRLAVATFLACLTGFFEVLLLYAVATLATAMAGGHSVAQIRIGPIGIYWPVEKLIFVAVGLVGALVAISFPLARILASVCAQAIIRMRERVLHAYLGATPTYRETHREGFLQQLVGDYCLRAENVVQQFASFCVAGCALMMILAGTVIVAPIIGLGLLAGIAVSGVFAVPLVRRVRKDAGATAASNREVAAGVGQVTRLSEEISSFNVKKAVAADLTVAIRKAATALERIRYEGRILPNLYQYGVLAAILGLMAYLGTAGPEKRFFLAPLAFLLIRGLTYTKQMMGALQLGAEMSPYVTAIDREVFLLEANATSHEGDAPSRFSNLRFESVCYAYKRGRLALRDVSFSVERGDIIGVAGPSGGGKSTMASLILRLRAPTSGVILANELSLAQITPDAWSQIVAHVPQDCKLIFGTVADNIQFFRPQYSLPEIQAAARAAHIHEEINVLLDGYDTVIGPGGQGLSGGQRQRLAIARALLAKPQLLVLDEPTSALDKNSEHLIGQTLQELKGHTTIILIAHRESTLRSCDRIFHLDQGRFGGQTH